MTDNGTYHFFVSHDSMRGCVRPSLRNLFFLRGETKTANDLCRVSGLVNSRPHPGFLSNIRLYEGLGSISTGLPSFVNSRSKSVSTISGSVRFRAKPSTAVPISGPVQFRPEFVIRQSSTGFPISVPSFRPKYAYRQFSTSNGKRGEGGGGGGDGGSGGGKGGYD